MGGGFYTTCEAVSTLEIAGFVSELLASQIFELTFDPGMERHPPLASLAPQATANQQPADRAGVSTPCGAISTR